MDPITCLAFVNDPSEDSDTRQSHMHYLAEWLARGGFAPLGASLTHEALVFAEDSGRDVLNLAAAVNVALVNADNSGLEGIGYKVLK